MKVWNVTLDEAHEIAASMGLRLERPKQVSKHAVSFGIRRDLTHWRNRDGQRRYAKLSSSWSLNQDGSRRICGSAVCWHGHRDFLRVLFCYHPAARVKTMFADYRSKADFEARFEATGDTNVGSWAYPMAARDACDCEED